MYTEKAQLKLHLFYRTRPKSVLINLKSLLKIVLEIKMMRLIIILILCCARHNLCTNPYRPSFPLGGRARLSFISTASIVHQFPRTSCLPNTFFFFFQLPNEVCSPIQPNKQMEETETNKQNSPNIIHHIWAPQTHKVHSHSLLLEVQLSLRSRLIPLRHHQPPLLLPQVRRLWLAQP